MKSIISILILLLSNLSFSQVIKLRTKSVNAQVLLQNQIWSEWTSPIDISELVVLDIGKKRISIFTKERQVYDITKTIISEKFDDGGSLFSFQCIDQNGDFSNISLIKENHDGTLNKNLIIELDDKKLIYTLEDIE